MGTEVGKIAGLIAAATDEPTPLQKELDRTGRLLSFAMLGLCGLVFATGVFVRGANTLGDVLQLFLFAVALAVAAIPEALPAIVTVGLSLGVRNMAAAHAIVRRLPAVETLGAASVICTDKTGTLTRNEMTVRQVVVLAPGGGTLVAAVDGGGYEPVGQFSVEGKPLAQQSPAVIAEIERTLRAGALANDAALVQREGRWAMQGDPTEGALIVAAAKLGTNLAHGGAPLAWVEAMGQRFPRLGEVPFTSERKRHTTINRDMEDPDRLVVFCKGAPDVLFGLCTLARVGETTVPLDAGLRQVIVGRNEALAAQALRTLALAYRVLPLASLGFEPSDWESRAAEITVAVQELARRESDLERDLVLLGVVGMIDPPRDEAKVAVATCHTAGIRPVMITGDHPQTALAIARELGILQGEGEAITGAQLSGMDAAALDRAVVTTQVYARVDPQHKLQIVEALQRRGEIVAMTGDGINDAPALKAANIGIAMGISGTDVSKEAADMVLTDDNFASIVRAVEEGRGTFDNIRKYLYYLLSCNAGELLTMFLGVMLASPLGLFNPEDGGLFLPLLAAQLLWINLITDGPPALALGIDPKDPGLMGRPPRHQGSGMISGSGWLIIVGVGTVMMLGTLAVLDASYPGGFSEALVRSGDLNASETYARTMAFTTLVLFQMFNVLNCRSTTRSAFFHLFENRWLWGAIALSVACQVAVVYVPALQVAFQTTSLTAGDWAVSVGVSSTILWLMELAKLVRRMRG
jgi:Ca2+-transporting ATPase